MKNEYLLKAFAVISALILVCTLCLPAFAASTVKVKVEIGSSEGLLYVRLTAPAGSDISTLSASLNFDETKLGYNSISYLEDASIVNSTNHTQADSGLVIANTVIAESLTDESKIFTYVFNIKDDAQGDVTFSFDNVVATNSNNENIAIVFEGPLTATLSELTPLTPDVIQQSFEPTTAPTEPSETEPQTEEQNQEAENVPNTNSKKIIAISTVGVLAIAGITGTAVVIKKKNEEE